jgi:hypothetical protein
MEAGVVVPAVPPASAGRSSTAADPAVDVAADQAVVVTVEVVDNNIAAVAAAADASWYSAGKSCRR